MKSILIDLLFLISAAGIVYGVFLIFRPASFIAAGILGIAAGIVMSLGG